MDPFNPIGGNNYEAEYAHKRLSNGRDDRQDPEKMWDDAKMRGKLGSHKADQLIDMIDRYKSRG